MKTKTLYWIGRTWYDNASNRIVGDMSYAFNDETGTRTSNGRELIKGMKIYSAEEIVNAMQYDGVDYLAPDADFPIYTVYKAKFQMPDEFDEWDDFCAEIADDSDIETVYVCALCTSERGKDIVENCNLFAGDYVNKK